MDNSVNSATSEAIKYAYLNFKDVTYRNTRLEHENQDLKLRNERL